MNNRTYEILLPLPGDGNYFSVCRCDTLESCVAVIAALLGAGTGSPGELRILVRYVD